jgi:hypothetical protein
MLEICTPAMQKHICFKSGRSTPVPEQQFGAAMLHVTLDGGCVGANVGSDAVVVLCPQNVCFCYCMRALLVNVFFCIRSKASFRMHFYSLPGAA